MYLLKHWILDYWSFTVCAILHNLFKPVMSIFFQALGMEI
jgi:hypothetical protein